MHLRSGQDMIKAHVEEQVVLGVPLGPTEPDLGTSSLSSGVKEPVVVGQKPATLGPARHVPGSTCPRLRSCQLYL